MAALYFREPTEEEKAQAGIEEPFTVLDRIETDSQEAQEAFDDMFEDSTKAFNEFVNGWRTSV